MKHIHLSKTARVLIYIAVVVILALATWQLFGPQLPELIKMIREDREEEIADYLSAQGEWRGLLSMFFLSIIQVISVVIPGIIIQFVGGMLYAWWKAFLMCYLGFVFANVLVFMFARTFRQTVKADKKKTGWIISTVNKYDPAFVFALACLVPGIPNGVIPYFAAAAKMRTREYAASVALSSWIQILSNCIAGHFLMQGQVGYMVLSFVAQIAIIIFCGMNRKKILDKFGRLDPKTQTKSEDDRKNEDAKDTEAKA